jgi:hypothetical protein
MFKLDLPVAAWRSKLIVTPAAFFLAQALQLRRSSSAFDSLD